MKQLKQQVKKSEREFLKLAPRVARDKDPEDLHRLRVLTRKLRACVWLIEHAGSNGLSAPLGRLKKKLRRLGKVLGARRELDVLLGEAATYQVRMNGRARKFEKRISCANRLISSRLCGDQLKSLKRRLRNLRHETSGLKKRAVRLAVAVLIARLERLKEENPKTPREWHRLRIEAKKVRYASEVLGLEVDELKRLQDLLGHGHDLDVLIHELGPRGKAKADMIKIWTKAYRIERLALKKAEFRLVNLLTSI